MHATEMIYGIQKQFHETVNHIMAVVVTQQKHRVYLMIREKETKSGIYFVILYSM